MKDVRDFFSLMEYRDGNPELSVEFPSNIDIDEFIVKLQGFVTSVGFSKDTWDNALFNYILEQGLLGEKDEDV